MSKEKFWPAFFPACAVKNCEKLRHEWSAGIGKTTHGTINTWRKIIAKKTKALVSAVFNTFISIYKYICGWNKDSLWGSKDMISESTSAYDIWYHALKTPSLEVRVHVIQPLKDKKRVPCGKQPHNYGKSPFLMGKSTISMAIFNSYVTNYQRVCLICGKYPAW